MPKGTSEPIPLTGSVAIFRSRRRTGTCELSARLFCRKPLSCAIVTGSSALAAAYEGSLSVTNFAGTMRYLRMSFRINPCGSLVPARLHKTIEHLAFRIDGSLQKHSLATNGDEHLVEVPSRMRLGPHCPQTSGDHWGFVTLNNPAARFAELHSGTGTNASFFPQLTIVRIANVTKPFRWSSLG